LFRFAITPLLIPWSDIKVRRSSGWLFDYVSSPWARDAIPLKISKSL